MLTAIIVLGFVIIRFRGHHLEETRQEPLLSSRREFRGRPQEPGERPEPPTCRPALTRPGIRTCTRPSCSSFPTRNIAPVKVPPGETFAWMLFKSKKNGKVVVLKDVTWGGAAPFDAFQFTIDEDGKRYAFLVPGVCGNVTLKSVAADSAAPGAGRGCSSRRPRLPLPRRSRPQLPPPPAPAPRRSRPRPRRPPAPAPVAAPAPHPVAAAPAAVAAPAARRSPVRLPPPVPPPVAKPLSGLLVDVGLSRQPDPANYLFARVGYELPLTGKLYLMGLVGGYVRWMGDDGGSAFTADAMLDYHWMDKISFGLGAGLLVRQRWPDRPARQRGLPGLGRPGQQELFDVPRSASSRRRPGRLGQIRPLRPGLENEVLGFPETGQRQADSRLPAHPAPGWVSRFFSGRRGTARTALDETRSRRRKCPPHNGRGRQGHGGA